MNVYFVMKLIIPRRTRTCFERSQQFLVSCRGKLEKCPTTRPATGTKFTIAIT